MPPIPNQRTIGSPPMPSRATSAFHRTARVLLHERASDYVMWVAGHGGDSATINTYLQSLDVFPSHFSEWAANKNRDTILASIPLLRTLMPSLSHHVDWARLDDGRYASLDPVPEAAACPVPPAVEVVVTLALQHHIMTKDQEHLRFTSGGAPSLSGQHSPSYDVLDAMANAFGTRRTEPL